MTGWPASVRTLLDANLEMLQAFEAERTVIDAKMCRDVLARINPPLNPHAEARAALIVDVEAALVGGTILAWHCTRLLPHERLSLEANGLRRHSRALFEVRIADAVAGEFLDDALGARLLENGQVAEKGRDDLLHLILNRQVLGDEADVVDLLANWGGEAIYNNAGRGREAALSIGVATIVEAVLPIDGVKLFWSIGEQMLSRYLEDKGIATEHRWGTNVRLRRDLPGAAVRRLIIGSDPEFEEMTGALGWVRKV